MYLLVLREKKADHCQWPRAGCTHRSIDLAQLYGLAPGTELAAAVGRVARHCPGSPALRCRFAQQPSGRRGPVPSLVPGLRWCAECEQILRKPSNSCDQDPDPRATLGTSPAHRCRVVAPWAPCSASLCLSFYIFKIKIIMVPTSQIITRIRRVPDP